ncbi:MAG: DUF502 domain-containing protein [Firmicutes bacterium]|nr:DUF502 domain-containing protein [Bacillota bacterium]
MKRLAKYFLQGVLVLLPITLTIYIVIWVFNLTDNILGQYYFMFLGVKIHGLGLLTTIALITLVGILSNWFVSRSLIDYIDRLFGSMPLVKLIYGIIKDTMNALVGSRSSFSKVVMVRLPGNEQIKLLGFVTAEEIEWLNNKDLVAVYILQSMQWAGFTILVPKDSIEFLDVSADRALQFIVSAGMTGAQAGTNGKRD